MKIALIIQRFPYGGAEQYVKQVATRMSACGHDVSVITSRGSNESDLDYNFRIVHLPILFSLGEYSFWMGLSKLLRDGRFDIVHINSYGYFHSDYAAFLKRRYNYKLVLTGHGLTGLELHQLKNQKIITETSRFDFLRDIYDRWIGQKTLASCDHLIALSKSDESFFVHAGIQQSRITIIPPGISDLFFSTVEKEEINRTRKDNDGEPVILTIGELSLVKNQILSIRAMPLILKEKPKARLLLIGRNRTKMENLKALSVKLGIENNVTFLGYKTSNEIKVHMHSSDLLLHTSLSEGLSTVLLEAMACGLPFLTTPAGGNGLLAEETKAGVVLPFQDEHALADKLLQLYNDKKQMEIMSHNGHIRANEFSWNVVYPKIMDVYETCLGGN